MKRKYPGKWFKTWKIYFRKKNAVNQDDKIENWISICVKCFKMNLFKGMPAKPPWVTLIHIHICDAVSYTQWENIKLQKSLPQD